MLRIAEQEAPNGQNEQWFGDGAASFLIGSGEDVIANIIDSGSLQGEIVSQWRSEKDDFTQSWEERLGSTVFMDTSKEKRSEFLEKNDLTVNAIAKVIISGPGTRAHTQAASALGFTKNKLKIPYWIL